MLDFFPVYGKDGALLHLKAFKLTDTLPEGGGVIMAIHHPVEGAFITKYLFKTDNPRAFLSEGFRMRELIGHGVTDLLFLIAPMEDEQDRWLTELLELYPPPFHFRID